MIPLSNPQHSCSCNLQSPDLAPEVGGWFGIDMVWIGSWYHCWVQSDSLLITIFIPHRISAIWIYSSIPSHSIIVFGPKAVMDATAYPFCSVIVIHSFLSHSLRPSNINPQPHIFHRTLPLPDRNDNSRMNVRTINHNDNGQTISPRFSPQFKLCAGPFDMIVLITPTSIGPNIFIVCWSRMYCWLWTVGAQSHGRNPPKCGSKKRQFGLVLKKISPPKINPCPQFSFTNAIPTHSPHHYVHRCRSNIFRSKS